MSLHPAEADTRTHRSGSRCGARISVPFPTSRLLEREMRSVSVQRLKDVRAAPGEGLASVARRWAIRPRSRRRIGEPDRTHLRGPWSLLEGDIARHGGGRPALAAGEHRPRRGNPLAEVALRTRQEPDLGPAGEAAELRGLVGNELGLPAAGAGGVGHPLLLSSRGRDSLRNGACRNAAPEKGSGGPRPEADPPVTSPGKGVRPRRRPVLDTRNRARCKYPALGTRPSAVREPSRMRSGPYRSARTRGPFGLLLAFSSPCDILAPMVEDAGAIGKRARRIQGRGHLRRLGPGLITGASDDDPSGIGTYSQVGAAMGYGLLWTALVSLPLASAV